MDAKITGMPQVGQPKPAGMLTETFAHKSFEDIKKDLIPWFAQKAVRQIIVIQTYPVSDHVGKKVNWFTVIHYMLYM
jgi:hypothetical protein